LMGGQLCPKHYSFLLRRNFCPHNKTVFQFRIKEKPPLKPLNPPLTRLPESLSSGQSWPPINRWGRKTIQTQLGNNNDQQQVIESRQFVDDSNLECQLLSLFTIYTCKITYSLN
jgi:hypothetical protein